MINEGKATIFNEDKKDEVPATGEKNTTWYAIIFMLLGGLGIIFCARKKEAWNKEN